MKPRPAMAAAVLSAFVATPLAAAHSAFGKEPAPTAGGARAALEKRLKRTYRDEFRHGDAETVVASCRRAGTHRREVQFSCRWRIEGDPFDDARYDIERPAGTAVVFASVKTPRKYRFLAMRGDDV